jgi:dTDP-glucose 4,6-dehydratase
VESFSHVVHAYGYPYDPFPGNKANINFDVQEKMLGGLRHTLDFCITCGVRKVLFISTGAIYGTSIAEMTRITEDFSCGRNPADIKNAYHEIRRMAEMICTIYSERFPLDIKIARCFAFIGPYMPLRANLAIGNFIGDALRGGPIIIKGDGTPVRSYLYMSDLAIWLWTILIRGGKCSSYNVGSEFGISILQAARLVANCVSPPPDIIIQNGPSQAFAPNRYVPDTSKAKGELGLSESVSLSKAIQRTIQWHRTNPL